ncbi:fasciclin-like arabinogalactan protein 11 [Populus alba]|uniref:Fasciclin-like AGP 13 n=2 Tax=Populus alba TaxID=43335 RepID=A0A4U5QVS0_POPAL|nr:fasciclin-like arabinogalactan protein 11 [Populus alba]TKS13135.1 fasciclin-like AGP 13 [Populus alba]
MRKQLLSPFVPFLMFFLFSSTTVAQTPSPAPSGPTNITAILEKAGQFTTLIRLMKSTQESDQINTQLNNSNQGLTVFAPPDNAFANLKAGALNSLSDQQKVQLVQFHIIPNFLSMSSFQTVSNPLRTQAGNSADGEFPLNVTTSGNQVNITTGVNTATVANTIFTDGQLVVYQVDQVLLPLDLFGTAAAPAPAPSKPDKDVPAKAPAGSKEDASADASGATIATVSVSLVLIAAISLKL